MKLKTLLYSIFILSGLFVSCKKSQINDNVTNVDSIDIQDTDLEKKIQYKSNDSKNTIGVDSTISINYLNKIIDLQNNLNTELVKADSSSANKLYENYSKLLIENLTDYNFSNSEILDNYVNYQDNEIPKVWKEKINFLKKHHIEIIYEGEGFYSFQFKHDYFYKTFKGKVTKDLEAFLYNYSEDDKNTFQMDAGIIVPWKDIRSRIKRWENFILKNPESRYITTAKEVYGFYLRSYLLGMENTRTYESKTKELYPEIAEDFQKFLKENPNKFSTELTKDFLEFFKFAATQYNGAEFENVLQQHIDGILQESLNQH